jgi:hypothetical protein
MTASKLLTCDGCGQPADSSHISRRLERLAWSTRFRPIHVHAVLLAGIAPKNETEFLYSPRSTFDGEAHGILDAVLLSTAGKSPESVQTEFQKLGLMLAHILECPLNDNASEAQAHALLETQLPSVIARIRRSLKPKRLLLISPELPSLAPKLHQANLACPIFPSTSGSFLASAGPTETDLHAFRTALAIPHLSASF